MAEYNMQELNLPGEDGKRILYPRMKLYGQVDLETITEKIAYASILHTRRHHRTGASHHRRNSLPNGARLLRED